MLSMRPGGRLVTCGSTSGVSAETNLMMLFQRQLRLIGSFGCRMQNMVDAMDKMAKGIVHPVVDSEVEFGDIQTALERMEARKVFGKIIMRVND
jgi:alcohol dehydrogenase